VKNRWKLVTEKYERHKKTQLGARDYYEEYLRTLEEEMAKSRKASTLSSTRGIEEEESE